MRERTLWNGLRSNVPGRFCRVENKLGTGTPDVVALFPNGSVAWIELKALSRWDSTMGLNAAQRLWLRGWGNAGGTAWLFAYCNLQYYAVLYCNILDRGTQDEWAKAASGFWKEEEFTWHELRRVLCRSVSSEG